MFVTDQMLFLTPWHPNKCQGTESTIYIIFLLIY